METKGTELNKEMKIIFLASLKSGFITPEHKKQIAKFLELQNGFPTLEQFYGKAND